VTTRSTSLQARAKINLILRVLERAPDGYHQLETLFQRIALADDVTVRAETSTDTLDLRWDSATSDDLGPVEENLAWRAGVAYRAASGWPEHFGIEITKRIPTRAGLGGGSADAAAVLRALDALAPEPLGSARLLQLAASLGADVPFLASGASLAIGRGRGDRIEILHGLPAASVVVVVPEFGISTAEAYADLARARSASAHSSPAVRLDASTLTTWEQVAGQQINDFEPTVFARYPALAAARVELERTGAQAARLSGSGSALFGLREEAWTIDPAFFPASRVIHTTTS
jgi:4-diphosphocytidyl-2-C-methyl-D-erythritol kinase